MSDIYARLLRIDQAAILRITEGNMIVRDYEIEPSNAAFLAADAAMFVRDRFQAFTQDQTSNQTKEQ